ncbi:hypothetical protein QYF36_022860 [Acer negundo]|nr:hypothetical protein QYF36_022860 [Acer negundo]
MPSTLPHQGREFWLQMRALAPLASFLPASTSKTLNPTTPPRTPLYVSKRPPLLLRNQWRDHDTGFRLIGCPVPAVLKGWCPVCQVACYPENRS